MKTLKELENKVFLYTNVPDTLEDKFELVKNAYKFPCCICAKVKKPKEVCKNCRYY